MSKHTPAPWEVLSSGGYPVSIYAPNRFGYFTIALLPAKGDYEEKTANAELIAAAPDMLEALEDMTARFERCCKYNQSADDEMLSEATKQAYTAIAKARGES